MIVLFVLAVICALLGCWLMSMARDPPTLNFGALMVMVGGLFGFAGLIVAIVIYW